MEGTHRKTRASKAIEAAVSAFLIAVFSPLLVACAIIVRTMVRCRGRQPASVTGTACGGGKRFGVKTMSEVMELLEQVPFRPRIGRVLGTLAVTVAEAVPTALNSSRTTAGLIYPYPDSFEPVIMESQDGTPVCGLLAMQPGGEVRPAVMVVHGLFSSKNNHGILSVALRAYYEWGFHVLALDLRNFGDSSRFSEAPTSWGFRESDDILAAAEYLESIDRVGTVGVVGVSMGASSALIAAARSQVDGPLAGGVVAVNGYADARMIVDHISRRSLPGPEGFVVWLTFKLMLLAKTALSGPRCITDFRRYTSEVSSQYYEIKDAELYRKASPINSISEIEVPCLIIHSSDDPVVPVGHAEDLAAAAKDNPMVACMVVPKGVHALYQVVSPGWFFATLESFLTYWGESGVCREGSPAGIDTTEMFGNPDN